MNRTILFTVILTSVVVATLTTLVLSLGARSWLLPSLHGTENETRLLESPTPESASLQSAERLLIDTVKKANPAVVAITISLNVPVYERYDEVVPSPFGDLFGDSFNFSVPRVRQQGTELQEVGGGSGFLVSDDGYIVTNRHVVSDEKASYTVTTNDGEQYPAKVIALDPSLDLAVIKIDGSNFSHLPFGDSDTLEVGQSVIAIGNALAEFQNTVSVGIVSGLSRSIVAASAGGAAESLDQLIQTDAAINQGNSGGPLLNLKGEVIGVNVAVANGAQNIGFALSANSVKNVVASVRATGRIVRPFLGIRYIPVTRELQQINDLSVDYGVLVQRGSSIRELAVIPGSPADKAGIVENDVVLMVDGTKLNEDNNLAALLRSKKVGDAITLTILHRGEEKTVQVTLEERT